VLANNTVNVRCFLFTGNIHRVFMVKSRPVNKVVDRCSVCIVSFGIFNSIYQNTSFELSQNPQEIGDTISEEINL